MTRDESASGPLACPGSAPGQRAEANVTPAVARHAAAHLASFKFAAVVTLETAWRSRSQYLSGVPGLMVRAPSCQRPTRHKYFPAVVYTDNDSPLRPGDKGVSVRISVPDEASGYFQSGEHFTVRDGTDTGHGTVARRLFFGWR